MTKTVKSGCTDFYVFDADYDLNQFKYGMRTWYNKTYTNEAEAIEAMSAMTNDMAHVNVGAYYTDGKTTTLINQNIVGLAATGDYSFEEDKSLKMGAPAMEFAAAALAVIASLTVL
mmetsp:Transcript_21676/g.29050  ORF Transcript_21676/g.29050 Transcript_21676/m.29050 type:complete len:116 (+) Transcript_21676:478-825(+)|eukprot:CAMPEP_0185580602 /NCGR_PEP_ID=MMETSP0434-20130131/17128_1 /TAXON_ID=626734 ORGANISM="Favella taraikaensis, Strain Fe Narragansett Bay" /NCGR_SAMPLE_ID=MMETSP0434 /ASSEMBLY_ACC=CAM_ASM_000379 /LENGTH=115 /DNA_ID=CAMNT_0028198913 /DNA_START=478 /DNA_END=825 /DNA_ORIENTATION=-